MCFNRIVNSAVILAHYHVQGLDPLLILEAPVLLSYPHMLWANETYSNTVQGLQPDPEKHETFVVVEPVRALICSI